MGVIKRNKRLSFNSSDEAESIDSSNGSNITFNRFLNSTNRQSNLEVNNPLLNPVVVSSEDEQMNNGNRNLLQLMELELRRSRRSPKKSQRKVTRAEASFVCLGVKGKSDRKKKRFENANMLTNPYISKLIIDEDIYKELDIYDFVPKTTMSPFALLLMDKDNMKIWNEFNELSEDEQDEVLNAIDDENKPKNKYKNDVQKTEHMKERNPICKSHHLSSKKRFDRINNFIKSFLRKKHIPLNYLESIENELVDNFKEDANSIYEICLETSYERLLVHACSQYHNLSCHSFNDREGARWTKVMNKCDYFEPSLTSLTAHLENLYFESSKK